MLLFAPHRFAICLLFMLLQRHVPRPPLPLHLLLRLRRLLRQQLAQEAAAAAI